MSVGVVAGGGTVGAVMAKKHRRSGKPAPGGRVTPKGVRPDGPASGTDDDDDDDKPGAEPPRSRLGGADQAHGRQFVTPPAPTRAGHHRGQR